MTQPGRLVVVLLAFLFLGHANGDAAGATPNHAHTLAQRQRRELSTHRYRASHKVRGNQSPKNDLKRRILKGSSASKGGSKGSKSQKGSKSKKSMSGNIFDHPDEGKDFEKEVVQVQCGSEESPFLATFVTSIRLEQPKGSKKSKKSRKDKSASKKSRVSYDEEEDEESLSELPSDDLSANEQRILEETFREVYNNWTFDNCDGFFRTVYTVSLTMVEREEDEEDYAVSLENTYRGGEDEVDMFVVNGTMDNIMMTGDGEEDDEEEDARWLQVTPPNATNSTSSPPSVFGTRDTSGSPASYVQTISGSGDLPIYYVSLAATCRNCAVTDEVNFPLLMLPEDSSSSHRALQAANATTVETDGEAVCTCLLPVEESETEISRRRRLDGHELYVPPPMGPTAEEFIQAMNIAIQNIQDNEGQLTRVAGLVDLIEPDYFEGENPDRERGPTNAPTTSPMPTTSAAPTQAPTVSAAPTSIDATPTTTPVTRRPTARPSLPPVTPPSATPSPTSSAPPSSTMVMTSSLGLVVSCALLVW